MNMKMPDIRDDIFRSMAGRRVTASIIADDEGLVVETAVAAQAAVELGLTVHRFLPEGTPVKSGDEIARFTGGPKEIAMAEDRLIGLMAKASGVATAAGRFVEKVEGRPKIVSGAWKKMPLSQKEMIRRAITAGGACCRISRDPFLYLDKNYVKMLGGIKGCLQAVAHLNGYVRVVQLKGDGRAIDDEACEAIEYGADILFVDSGSQTDLTRISSRLRRLGLRERVKIAFGGNIRLEDIDAIKSLDVDILDIGRQIVDAPLLDMRMEVIHKKEA
jgi:nicotinate-nucleotide pyrophosphorylase (carboxylating)